MERLLQWELTGETAALGENLSTANAALPGLVLRLGHRGEQQQSNSQCCGTNRTVASLTYKPKF
jgi:hypothetical protein